MFPEVKQNWLGYSLEGNEGSGLGLTFARALHRNLGDVFRNFGSEQVTRGSHMEKLCLIESGVGRDNISDFTTNLIKRFLLDYTQEFALEHVPARLRAEFAVNKVDFNYSTESWRSARFELPALDDDFVLLTPRDILTKDESWINRRDLYGDFHTVLDSLPSDQLRDQLNNYVLRALPEKPSKKDEHEAILKAIRAFPEFIEYFIRFKEEHGDQAAAVSDEMVSATEQLFVEQLSRFVEQLGLTAFYQTPLDTKEESRARVDFLKDVIENKGGWRVFYVGGEPLRRESDLHVLFRLTWFGTPSDVSREVDDGRGPADFKISRGRWDKTILEFKLAKNKHLKQNLQAQADAYRGASDAEGALYVIVHFTPGEFRRVERILRDLGLTGHPDIVLIDAQPKPSASVA